ncbi:Protein FAR1-RELATED SEQUENCE 5 [Linum grandiflorum]
MPPENTNQPPPANGKLPPWNTTQPGGNTNQPPPNMNQAPANINHSSEGYEIDLQILFDTKEDAYAYYKRHAHKSGFATRIRRNSERNPANNGAVDVTPRVRDCPEERCGCEAELRYKWDQDIQKYGISEWIRTHNHELAPPEAAYLHTSNRKVSHLDACLAQIHQQAGVRPRSSFDIMLQIAGGAANVGFTIRDLRNHQRLPRSQFLDSADLTMMLKHFRQKARVDKNLYYEMSEHADGEILSVFWADGRMRSDYASFGDAVSFDTTYRTNRECRPLGTRYFFRSYSIHITVVLLCLL